MRIKTLPALIALGLTGVAASAHALDDRWYVAPTASYVISDSDRQADDGWGAGIAIGKPLNEKWNVEFGARANTMDFETGGGDYDQFSLGLDGLYFFNRNPGFAPYAVMGLGYLRTDVPAGDDNSLMANVGLGFMKQLSDNVALRADARYRFDSNEGSINNKSDFGDWLVTVGLNIALGQAAQPAPKAEPKPAPAAEPMPAPVAKPEPVKPAPVDSDGDGVVDTLDQCPNTPAGDKVDSKGCTLTPIIVLKGVNFDHDSAKLRPEAQAILDDAVTTLKRYTEIKVEVAGHTDSQGTTTYNQKLSERRARSVMEYFATKGIAAERMSAKGYGESQPVADNATAAGRALNRRVELRIVDGK